MLFTYVYTNLHGDRLTTILDLSKVAAIQYQSNQVFFRVFFANRASAVECVHEPNEFERLVATWQQVQRMDKQRKQKQEA